MIARTVTLEDLARLTRERAQIPAMLVALREQGYTWPQIAAAAGMTRQGTERIAKRANGGKVPTPRTRTTAA